MQSQDYARKMKLVRAELREGVASAWAMLSDSARGAGCQSFVDFTWLIIVIAVVMMIIVVITIRVMMMISIICVIMIVITTRTIITLK